MFRYGQCRNAVFCSLAEQKAVLRLGETELFTCPECAAPLVPARAWRVTRRRPRPSEVLAVVYSIAVAAAVVWWQWPAQPAAPVAVRMAAHPPVALALPAPHVVPAAKIAVDHIVLRIAATPPLSTVLLPNLAAAYLGTGQASLPLFEKSPTGMRIRLPEAPGAPAISVTDEPREAAFDTLAQGQADLICTDAQQTPAQRGDIGVQLQTTLAAAPDLPGVAIICYARPQGYAADVMAWLGTPEAQHIIAASGYAPFVPPPPPKPAPPKHAAPIARVAAPAATPVAAPPAPVVPPPPPPPPPAQAQAQAQAQAPVAAIATPKPRSVYLPASMSGFHAVYGALKDVTLPNQNTKMLLTDPNATRVPGSVKVDCDISVQGVPSDCREIAHTGNEAAAASILAWLPSGALRYPPTIKNGEAVEERRQLTVSFGATALPPPE